MSQRIVIAGGGLTGLTAAYYLRKKNAEAEIVVVEPGRLGGKVQTDVIEGCYVENAPDSWVAHKPWLGQLCDELGVQRVGANPKIKKTYVYSKGSMQRLPEGLQLMIPTKAKGLMASKLMSPQGKLRALMEPKIPLRQADEDESIGSFVRRRFGKEMLDQIAGPLMGGIYGGDWNQVSMKATFPQYLKVEREQGSLLRWARRNATTRGTTGSAFQTCPTGLRTIIDKLLEALEGKVRFVVGQSVSSVVSAGADEEVGLPGGGYEVGLSGGEVLAADAVVLATPAYVSAALLEGQAPDVAEALNQIDYTNSVVVALVYNRAEVDHPLDATGFLIPKGEPMELTASTWVSSKWEHAAPEDKVLLRGFLGRIGGKDWTKAPDEEAVAAVLDGLEQTMGITAKPIAAKVYRWARANAQYRVGHLERVAEIDRKLGERARGLILAGAAYSGVGLPDCVREGLTAAERIARHLSW